MGVLNGMSPDNKGVALPKSEFASRPPASSLDRSAGDEELTNLNWLQKNLLQDFTLDVTEAPPSPAPLVHSSATPHRGPAQKAKPPLSFSLLIYMAIDQSPGKSLAVKDIYNWILQHFPYFSSAPTGWKNSVRHNLSLNKCFRKVEKSLGKVSGKGSLWCVDPEHRPNLVQALKKQHFPTGSLPPPASSPRVFSGQIFLQRCALRESDIDAASAMMLLNSGSGHHNDFCDPHSPSHSSDSVLVSSDPKQDHTYSSSRGAGSEGFLSDEDEGSEEEQRSGTMELDEELKEAAGSLLHLAGVQPGLDLCRRTLRNSTKISFLRD